MKAKIIFLLLVLSSVAFSQNINIETTGTCKEFTVKITTQLTGCWDAKIGEADADILHPDGWQSSFFYLDNAVCGSAGEMNIRLNTKNDATAILKLRQNSTIVEKQFRIDQNCPVELGDRESMLVVLTIIIILSFAIAIYLKRPKRAKKRRRR